MNKADRVDQVLTEIQGQRWSGPGHDLRIEKLIREVQQMKQASMKRFSVGMLVAVGVAGVLGGGAIAGVVTHRVMAQRALLTGPDGTQYEVMLSPTPEGSAGTLVTDDGTTYGVDVVDEGEQRTMSVDVSGLESGESETITVETPEDDS
ncbi:MAG: hypothetical protein ACI89L_002182 [Phycisphaerales bacterium]|jgi:hypothetical protein